MDFIDWYKSNEGNFVDDPGALFVNLLLMGDRESISGAALLSEHDRVWGGGRLRARKFDDDGMDSPWLYADGGFCVSDGEVVSLFANGGFPLSTQVDHYKAAIYWYDAGHDNSGTQDDIDLRLYDADTNQQLIASLSALDEKEFVFATGVGGKRLRLDIEGFDVTSDAAGCGTNSMFVYVARFWEDGSPNDIFGPSEFEIVPEDEEF